MAAIDASSRTGMAEGCGTEGGPILRVDARLPSHLRRRDTGRVEFLNGMEAMFDRTLMSRPPRGAWNADDTAPPHGMLRWTLAQGQMREALRAADVVLGCDAYEPEKTYLFHGQDVFEQPGKTGASRRPEVLKVAVDFFTDDAETLRGACIALKGSCCYRDGV